MKEMKRALSILFAFSLIVFAGIVLSSCGDKNSQILQAYMWKHTYSDGGETRIRFKSDSKDDSYGDFEEYTITKDGEKSDIKYYQWAHWQLKNRTILSLSYEDNSKIPERLDFIELDDKDLANDIVKSNNSQWYVSDKYLVLFGTIFQPAD